MLTREIILATPRLLERFYAKIMPVPWSGCHIWLGKIMARSGHGDFQLGGRGSPNIKAHRLSYIIERGEIPEDTPLLHQCDIACCVNAWHCEPGTIIENNRQMVERGRVRNGATVKTLGRVRMI